MSKRTSALLILAGIVMSLAMAATLVYLKSLRADRTVVFQIHSSLINEFATLVDDNHELIGGVKLGKHSAGPGLWEFHVPIRLTEAQATERKALVLGRIRDWIDAETSISPQAGLVVHSGAENPPIERADEWSDPVVELLSEAVAQGRDETDD